MAINDDLQVCVNPQANMRAYGSVADNQVAISSLLELRNKIYESDKAIIDILIQSLSSVTEVSHLVVGELVD